eukprot:149978_1
MPDPNTADGNYTHIEKILTISYILIQSSIAILVSIIGAYYVYEQRKYENHLIKQSGFSTNQDTKQIQPENQTEELELQPANQTNSDNKTSSQNQPTEIVNKSKNQCMKFTKLWAKIMWKMRSVYSSLAVHSFDVLTDVLVIIEWLNTPNYSGDHINPQLMAYSGIAIIIFSKLFSSIAIFIKERNIIRAILQFFDLLIFTEIFDAHKKIKSQLSQKQKNKTAIEATLSFKYIRQMEAVFESVPQSILQLVYIMRTGTVESNQTIFIISILQSIISMTNSNLNHDYTRMLHPQYKKYKQKLPPTIQFFKHSICRLAEITHRIGLLSLIWTVCGGQIFSVVLGIEFLIKFISTEFLFQVGEILENMDSVLLAITCLVIVPSEEMYSIPVLNLMSNENCTWWFLLAWVIGTCGGCFVLITISIAGVLKICIDLPPICFTPLTRMHLSFLEFMLVILYGIFGENGDRESFLLSTKHGLGIFIVTCIFYVIWTQYLILFPNVTLPLNVNVRSKWGYAYGNELSELKKLKWNSNRVLVAFMNNNQIFQQEWVQHRKTLDSDTNGTINEDFEKESYFQSWKGNRTDIDDLVKKFYWDEYYHGTANATPAIFALANENYEIVQWLEYMGAVSHKNMSSADARNVITGKSDANTIVKTSDAPLTQSLMTTVELTDEENAETD